MSRKKNKRQKTSPRSSASRRPAGFTAGDGENRTADAATVFWMTALLATLLAQVCALAARLFVTFAEAPPALALVSNVMLIVAALAGIICLIMTPVVLRWRREPPPVAITRFAVAASLLPLGTLIAVLVSGM